MVTTTNDTNQRYNNGQWQNVTVIRNGKQGNIYVNGTYTAGTASTGVYFNLFWNVQKRINQYAIYAMAAGQRGRGPPSSSRDPNIFCRLFYVPRLSLSASG